MFIIGGSRVHVCRCALHAAQLHLNLYSPHALKRSMADQWSRFNSKCVTFCITGTGDLVWLLVGCWQSVPDPGISDKFSFHLGSNDLFLTIHFLTRSKFYFVNIWGHASFNSCFCPDSDYFGMA